MALTDLAKKSGTPGRKGPTCRVCLNLATLPPAEADALRKLLSDPTWRYTELSDRLKEDPDTPLDIAPTILANHARGRCLAREKLRG